MSKICQRPERAAKREAKLEAGKLIKKQNREAAKGDLQKKKGSQVELRRQLKAEGLVKPPIKTPASRRSPYSTGEEEGGARIAATVDHSRVLSVHLPRLLKILNKVRDVRQPGKIKYTLAVLMLYGILIFVYQFASRRKANTGITRPMFMENLHLLFPELDGLPHADTLYRLLCQIEVEQIEQAHTDLVNHLIRKKKFVNYLIEKGYPIAIDGTQKLGDCQFFSDSLGQRQVPTAAGEASTEPVYQYHVYVLEANLCFHNGMVIPLMSEFLDYKKGDSEQNKQDCEQKAFHRLAERIKKAFPRLPIMLLLDGLYPTAPVMKRCRDYNWDFMIVLKDGSLQSVWDEYHGLLKLQPGQEYRQNWGERKQIFRWVNGIWYEYSPNARKRMELHVVVCHEEWREVDEKGEIVTKTAKHAWISGRKLNRDNLHQRCNLGARHRWGIEACNLVEKHQGYQYEHTFAQDWNAMRGYHYLMRLAHLINTLARFSGTLAKLHLELGAQAFIEFLRSTLSGPWFTHIGIGTVRQRMREPFRLRLT